jgi:hypothetical protein
MESTSTPRPRAPAPLEHATSLAPTLRQDLSARGAHLVAVPQPIVRAVIGEELSNRAHHRSAAPAHGKIPSPIPATTRNF